MATCNGNCVGAATEVKGADSKLMCMHCAAQDGRLHSLVTMCELGGKELWLKRNFGQTPLFTACQFGHVALVKELLDRGGSELWMMASSLPTEETSIYMNCLYHAIELKQVEVAKLLCERPPALMYTSYQLGKTLTVAAQRASEETKAREATKLCAGAAVKIHSRKSAAECNDLLGEVHGVDPEVSHTIFFKPPLKTLVSPTSCSRFSNEHHT
jgi:hypothetical protein